MSLDQPFALFDALGVSRSDLQQRVGVALFQRDQESLLGKHLEQVVEQRASHVEPPFGSLSVRDQALQNLVLRGGRGKAEGGHQSLQRPLRLFDDLKAKRSSDRVRVSHLPYD